MKYITHNDDAGLDCSGTCLQGSIETTFEILEDLFGLPMPGDGHKTDAEWVIKTEEGTLITVYNWKNGRAYNGRYGDPVELITRWNVGGTSRLALMQLREIVAQITKVAA